MVTEVDVCFFVRFSKYATMERYARQTQKRDLRRFNGFAVSFSQFTFVRNQQYTDHREVVMKMRFPSPVCPRSAIFKLSPVFAIWSITAYELAFSWRRILS